MLIEWTDTNGHRWQCDVDADGDDIAPVYIAQSLRSQGRARVSLKRGATWTRPAPTPSHVNGKRDTSGKRVREPETCLCGLNCARLRLEERVPTQDVTRRELLRRAFADTAYLRPCQAPTSK